jgi:hypothetical protein
VERQENMEGNIFVMDTVMDGPLLLGKRTYKVINDVGDTMFHYYW